MDQKMQNQSGPDLEKGINKMKASGKEIDEERRQANIMYSELLTCQIFDIDLATLKERQKLALKLPADYSEEVDPRMRKAIQKLVVDSTCVMLKIDPAEMYKRMSVDFDDLKGLKKGGDIIKNDVLYIRALMKNNNKGVQYDR